MQADIRPDRGVDTNLHLYAEDSGNQENRKAKYSFWALFFIVYCRDAEATS
jgi:hypothetical protein